jgi:hypothetical protein
MHLFFPALVAGVGVLGNYLITSSTVLELTTRARAMDARVTTMDIRITALDEKTDARFEKSNDMQEGILRKLTGKVLVLLGTMWDRELILV